MKYVCVECGELSKIKQHEDEVLYGGMPREILHVCSACEWPNVIRIALTNVSKDYQDAYWLRTAYITNGKSMAVIAEECGVSAMTIYTWLKRHNIETRSRGQRS